MAAIVEALGMSLPGSATPPAGDARRYAFAEAAGRRAVALAREQVRPSQILTPAAFENAITLLVAIGGSTNAVLHLLALAGRVGVTLDLERFDAISGRTPLLVNVRPAGEHLVERLFHAGGIPAVLKELEPLLELDAPTVAGQPIGSTLPARGTSDRDVIATLDDAFKPAGGLAVLKGSLAPSRALIKRSAASERLMHHRGPAVVFEDIEDLADRIDDPALDVDERSVLVLRNAGPRGAPGMPEWGQLPIPAKLLAAGVTDMLRISDARMSGTAFGTNVLHVAPESAAGGPLAVVRTGDPIELDVEQRRLDLALEAGELERRLSNWSPPPAKYERGYGALYLDRVLQADEGCDFDFLRGRSAKPEDEPYGLLQGWIGGW
jgi:dihydroxy-acid dehydratase